MDCEYSNKQMLTALREHEWELSSDRKHMTCHSCGARTEASTLTGKHNAGCVYDAMIRAYLDRLTG
jgi:hypothetical protein